MRTLSVVEFVTLDGVMQAFEAPDPDDPGFPYAAWGLPYQDGASAEAGIRGQSDTTAYLLGRKTYQRLGSFWPHQSDDNPMAAHINRTPKYVATRTLSTLDWQPAHALTGDLVPAVQSLKQEGEGSIVVLGSGALVQQLMAAELVDTYTLFVHPLVLGTGARLFRELDKPIPLHLLDVTRTSTGVLVLTYAVRPSH
ncbi:MAG: dihydrofolate reductase family protein [Micromonosporaceae bacterium]|nr:dihydrofolate reductase family protein [Micromonosporaceae bacterium]